MRKIIAEAKLVQSQSRPNLFYADDKEHGLYINLDVASKAMYALKPYVGQIVTISVETSNSKRESWKLFVICLRKHFESK